MLAADPDVSVVIPAYNAARTLPAAIESALNQTYRPAQIIVIDDGSADDTAAAVGQFGDKVEYVRTPNRGPAPARNTGIERARGELVAFLDADDLWLPAKLERQVQALAAHPEAGAVQCGAIFVDHALHVKEIRLCPLDGDVLWDVSHFRNLPAFLSTLVVHRRCLATVGPFDSSLKGEDWDMAIRLARFCGMISLPDALAYYRVHATNRSRIVEDHIGSDLTVLSRLYAGAGLPVRIHNGRRSIYASCYRTYAGGYFNQRRFGRFAYWATRAVMTHPAELLTMLGWPARLLARARSRHQSPGVQSCAE